MNVRGQKIEKYEKDKMNCNRKRGRRMSEKTYIKEDKDELKVQKR